VWVFGYGSLMGDNWEQKFGSLRRCVAVLEGYRRTFNKASVTNWGTKETPCPTLNLNQDQTGRCQGIAFEFPDDGEHEVREYLRNREGKAFPLELLTIRLKDGAEVQAHVPVYRGKNLVAIVTAQEKAVMVKNAVGNKGSCRRYVKEIADSLARSGIDDPVVTELWQAVQKESLPSMMAEIRERLEMIESSLPRRVDAMVSPDSKLPFNALLYREAVIWRMAELSRGAFENFEKDKLAIALLLTRAAVETSAGLWFLNAKLEAAVRADATGDIDDYLIKLGMGSRTDSNMPEALNVLKFIDRVEKDVEGFRHQYDILSEFAHPNWAGTALLYSKPDPPNLWTDFGANIRGLDSPKQIGVVNLSVALMFFERSYNRIGDVMPAFTALCERSLKADDDAVRAKNDARGS
jgi:cation transport regulator ChaC